MRFSDPRSDAGGVSRLAPDCHHKRHPRHHQSRIVSGGCDAKQSPSSRGVGERVIGHKGSALSASRCSTPSQASSPPQQQPDKQHPKQNKARAPPARDLRPPAPTCSRLPSASTGHTCTGAQSEHVSARVLAAQLLMTRSHRESTALSSGFSFVAARAVSSALPLSAENGTGRGGPRGRRPSKPPLKSWGGRPG